MAAARLTTLVRPGVGLVGAAVIALAACSKIDTPPDTGPACGAWFDALAKFQTRCGAPEVVPDRLAQLRGRFVDSCDKLLAAPGTSKSITSLNLCAQFLDARACDAASSPDSADPCADAPGSLRDGAVCFSDDQCSSAQCKSGRELPDGGPVVPTLCGICAPRLHEGEACSPSDKCDGDMQCVSGQCEHLQPRELGQPCADPFNPCKAGGLCKGFVCVKAGGAGDACAANVDCDPTLACIAQKCAQQPVEGAACDAVGQCTRGLGCDLEAKKCQKPQVVRLAEACNVETLVCEIGVCVFGADGVKGTCPILVPDGAECDPANKSAVCDQYASCIDGVCQIYDPTLCR
jgi:hypothetical protein